MSQALLDDLKLYTGNAEEFGRTVRVIRAETVVMLIDKHRAPIVDNVVTVVDDPLCKNCWQPKKKVDKLSEQGAIEAATMLYEGLRQDNGITYCMSEAVNLYKRKTTPPLPRNPCHPATMPKELVNDVKRVLRNEGYQRDSTTWLSILPDDAAEAIVSSLLQDFEIRKK